MGTRLRPVRGERYNREVPERSLSMKICNALALAACFAFAAPGAEAVSALDAFEMLGIDEGAQYAATRVVTADGQSVRFKEYRKGESMRLEINAEGMQSVMIADKGKGYAVMPQMNAYLETDLSDVVGRTGWNEDSEFATIEKVGREPVGTVPATRYHVTYSEPGNEGEGDLWVSDDGVLMRVLMQVRDGGQVSEVESSLEELVMGPQPDDLFRVPAGYTAIQAGGLFKAIGNLGAPAPGAAPPPSASGSTGGAVDGGSASTPQYSHTRGAAGAGGLRDALRKLIPKGSQ
jgi:hypothetical protein